MIETLQKLVPWLPTLPMAAKISLTGVVCAVAFFSIAIIWSHPPQRTSDVSSRKIQELLYELATIQSDFLGSSSKVEPLAERAKALIETRFPIQATAISNAQQMTSTADVARILEMQLKIVKDQLPDER